MSCNLQSDKLASRYRPFMYTLQEKVCTIVHYLCASNILLKQGWFTFCLKFSCFCFNFIPKTQDIQYFVKVGHQLPKQVLHLASNQVLISDLDSKYVLPFEIALILFKITSLV